MSPASPAAEHSRQDPGRLPRARPRSGRGLAQGTSLSPPDPYLISEYLAEGGMGTIYLGQRRGVGGFEREVVLKELLPQFAADPQVAELFLQEARLSATLDHPNIVHTQDLVQIGGKLYMVMEYVRGGDLRALLRRARQRQRRFAPQAAVFIAREILDALRYIHGVLGPDERPIVHRDISPSNVLLSAQGEAKLSDFGIAQAGVVRVRGKIGYMSPEQARGEEIDARSDLFSLAVVLYEVLTGERLYIGEVGQSPGAVYGIPVVPPSRRCRDVPRELDGIVLRALELQPDRRYQSAPEFYDALCWAARRLNLLIGHVEMAAHLREVCGADPGSWRRPVERTGTAMISPNEPSGDVSEPPGVAAPDEDPALETRVNPRLVAATDETALLSGDGWTPPLVGLAGLAGLEGSVEPALDAAMTPEQPIVSEPQIIAASPLRGAPGAPRGAPGAPRGAPRAPRAIERSDRTVPLPARPGGPGLGIADMARKMVYRRAAPLKEASAWGPVPAPLDAGDSGERDTESVTRIRPGVTLQMMMLDPEEVAPAGVTVTRPPPPSRLRGWQLVLGAVLLLGLGVLLGAWVTSPRAADDGDGHGPGRGPGRGHLGRANSTSWIWQGPAHGLYCAAPEPTTHGPT